MTEEKEFFIHASSFAAPFVSDFSIHYQKAASAEEALEKFAAAYDHPCGLYAARAYTNADAYHKGEPHLAEWLSNHERARQKAVKSKSGHSYLGDGPGHFRIDQEWHTVEHPKQGSVVPKEEPPDA